MKPSNSKYRWFVVGIFFTFMLLHQSDKLLIGPLTPEIMKSFDITKTQMGAVVTGALLVGTVLYPLWGYLYDRYARAKLLALASFIWGATTWLSAIAPSYGSFLATRASTGIDDSSYPGLFSLIADYFAPNIRGRIYGLLQLSQPLGYLLGMILALMVAPMLGWDWRNVFYITGGLGILLAIVIFFGVRDVPRGKSEPALENLEEMGVYRFSKEQALGLFKKRSLWFMFLQGFAGVFPWNVITYWFFTYLAEERGYDENSVLLTMAPAVLILAGGYFLGGALGDYMFKRTLNGRIIVAMVGVLTGAIFLFFTMSVPVENRTLFFILLCLTALFIPLSSPNVISTVYDVTLPEVRSTALSIQYFIENGGAALAPLLAGIIADASNLHTAILTICITTWLLCFVFYLFAIRFLPGDIQTLRQQLQERADYERAIRAAV
ncbi:MAG: MFS transporter [Chloroflexi bacterium]|nr:MFS transporter [Chloroflexota bacterium]